MEECDEVPCQIDAGAGVRFKFSWLLASDLDYDQLKLSVYMDNSSGTTYRLIERDACENSRCPAYKGNEFIAMNEMALPSSLPGKDIVLRFEIKGSDVIACLKVAAHLY